ncbi:hypothetical protein [Heyndrickxia ginsengihumi]|uniref:Uncharacterized protein n=1 Tax=Heyndrickxia ginsengihumi TaxID=363870 RepID=A0A6M0PBP6_9BACI|nr:hypothetical protein [Heyndrickxia ginsengihumi]MCM3024850.1 hypothetical protein [Heyndrickxia ginsengihumi]NEY20778.1 hypothetical protein [Heyndrickxia ginsengihumi]
MKRLISEEMVKQHHRFIKTLSMPGAKDKHSPTYSAWIAINHIDLLNY